MRFRLAVFIVVLSAVALPASASASEIIDRNASNVTLKAAANGQALISFNARGKRWNVLAWGAMNALQPTTARKQIEFKLDYSGGYGTYKRDVWRTFKNTCRAYDGPELQWFVAGCKAADGSYWALQSWQRALPNYGLPASGKSAVWELRLSHWRGELPQLTVNLNWAYKSFHHIFGSFRYLGKPVHGFKSTASGVPLDTFGRNLYVDTFNSAYGQGWKRENSFLMHKGTGKFCYGFYSHGSRPVGSGERYRATIIGPGVLPDIYWEADALTAYDKDFDLLQHAAQKEFLAGDPLCKAV
jgi:hypothetical protein